uniref:Protein FAR1-RELATED SEQUENCE n=1 Tax=Aegilops tauschii subsp. strangulata TaxID=200361 RepID=A0A453SSU1_AEGTS
RAATIPPCCVSKRWTMEAKAAFVSVRNANTHVWSKEMSRYRELRNIASIALFKVSKSGERSQEVKDYLQSIIDGPIENDDNTEETTFGPIPSHYSAASHASADRVLDPKIVDTKGAPCKKRIKPFHETLRETNGRKKRTRRCGQCKSSEHDRRRCPDLGK